MTLVHLCRSSRSRPTNPLNAEAVPQSPLQPEERAGDPGEQGDAEQGRAPADEEDVGQHGKGDDGRQDLRQVSQGVKRCPGPARERRREKPEKEKKQGKRPQSGKHQPEKKEPSPERDTPGRAGLPPSRRVHGMILSIFPLSVSHRLVNSSSGRADARMASTAPRTSPIRARVWDRTSSIAFPTSMIPPGPRASAGEGRAPSPEAWSAPPSRKTPLRTLRTYHRNASDPPAKTRANRTRSRRTRIPFTIRKGVENPKWPL